MLVLRHKRRLPSAATSFVEQIGERVLILAGVPSKLDDYSLVFFHRELEIMSQWAFTDSVPEFWGKNDRAHK